MRGRHSLLILLVVISGIASGGMVASADEVYSGESVLAQGDDIDADQIRIDIALEQNGSAKWTIGFWVQLDDAESEEAFESIQQEIADAPEDHLETFRDRIDETVQAASDATGREMATDNFDVRTDRQSVARDYGVVTYSFDWHGFSMVDGEEIHAGDAIEGMFLDDGTRLLVSWPGDYELSSVQPTPDDERDNAVIWRGGTTEFVSDEPRLTIAPSGTAFGWDLIAVGLGTVAAVAIIGGWWLRRRGQAPVTGDQPTEQMTDPDEALLRNEEQVMRLLEEHGGRMKQKMIVEELGWTDAKTSQVVSNLREDGEIESFRLGRENVLSIPEDHGE